MKNEIDNYNIAKKVSKTEILARGRGYIWRHIECFVQFQTQTEFRVGFIFIKKPIYLDLLLLIMKFMLRIKSIQIRKFNYNVFYVISKGVATKKKKRKYNKQFKISAKC